MSSLPKLQKELLDLELALDYLRKENKNLQIAVKQLQHVNERLKKALSKGDEQWQMQQFQPE